jgi:hypothetical protein
MHQLLPLQAMASACDSSVPADLADELNRTIAQIQALSQSPVACEMYKP